jgi:hypothetical protein
MPQLFKHAKPLERIKKTEAIQTLWRLMLVESLLERNSKDRSIICAKTASADAMVEGRFVATTPSKRGESQLPDERCW